MRKAEIKKRKKEERRRQRQLEQEAQENQEEIDDQPQEPTPIPQITSSPVLSEQFSGDLKTIKFIRKKGLNKLVEAHSLKIHYHSKYPQLVHFSLPVLTYGT